MTSQSSALPPTIGPRIVVHGLSKPNDPGSTSKWNGHSCTRTNGVCSRTTSFVQQVFNNAGFVASDTNTLASIFRRLNEQVFDAAAMLKQNNGYFDTFRAAIGSFTGFVDTLQVVGDVQYFYTRGYQKDGHLAVAAHTALSVANVGGALLWFQDLGFIKLGNMAKAIGGSCFFRAIPKQAITSISGCVNLSNLSVRLVAGRALTLYYLISAADSMQKLVNERNAIQKKQAGLELTYYLSEVALTAALAIGSVGTLGLGALGVTCIVTGLTSFLHKKSMPADEAKKDPFKLVG